mmetsp:Transcript_56787/g.122763  ORF Transcript_56787/g.122763 Transcript_56787/m.122763 type:complete len:108 (+) Transcript_56787:1791-2114(+)
MRSPRSPWPAARLAEVAAELLEAACPPGPEAYCRGTGPTEAAEAAVPAAGKPEGPFEAAELEVPVSPAASTSACSRPGLCKQAASTVEPTPETTQRWPRALRAKRGQ